MSERIYKFKNLREKKKLPKEKRKERGLSVFEI